MGRTHALLGATLGLALASPLASEVLHRPLHTGEMAAFTLATAGYSLAPDFDHPQATLARTLGPVTKAIAGAICGLSGGHRKGTHTVWFAAAIVALVAFLSSTFGRSAELPLLFVGYYIGLMILRLAPKRASSIGELVYAIEAAGLVAATYHWVGSWWWLPWAVGLGVVWHIVGDLLTVEGVPIFFPLARKLVIRFPVLGHTDSMREHIFALALIPAFAWVVLATATGNHWWTTAWAAHPESWKVVTS